MTVFGRTGDVVAVQSDYTYLQSFNARTGPAILPVQSDYTYLGSFNARVGPAILPVQSDYTYLTAFNTRTGPAVTPVQSDYTYLQTFNSRVGPAISPVQSDYTYLTTFNSRVGPAISPVQSDYTYLSSFNARTGPAISPVQSDYTYIQSFNARTGPAISPVGSDYSIVGISGVPALVARDLLFATSATALDKLALGPTGKVLKVVGSALSWSDDSQGAGGGGTTIFPGLPVVMIGSSSGTTVTTSLLTWNYSRSTVSGTATETAIVNFLIPASTISAAGRMITVDVSGLLFNATTVNRTATFRIYHGSTARYNDATLNIPTSNVSRVMNLRVRLMPSASTNSCIMAGTIMIGPGDAATAGVGGIGAVGLIEVPFRADPYNLDLTSAQSFMISVAHSTTSSLINTAVQAMTARIT